MMSTQKSNITINFHFRVPAEKAAAVEAGLAVHADWMRTTHSIGPGKNVELVDYYVTRADELKNPVDPSQGTTGYVLFFMNETYPDATQMGNHFTEAQRWDGFGDLLALLQENGATVLIGGQVIQSL